MHTDNSSYWIDTATAPQRRTLDRDLTVDVLVVGAGIAGVCTAWELSRTGRSVALVEARRVLEGTSGFTTAKLTAQHSLIYHHLATTFGKDTARTYALAQQDAISHVSRTATELDIDCDLEATQAFTYTSDYKSVDTIKDEVAAAHAAGLTASLVVNNLPFDAVAAIRVEYQAQFHPRKFLLALLADFEAHGGQVFEQTRVVAMNHGSPSVVDTVEGRAITAQSVVLATHFPIFDRTLLFPRLAVHGDWVVAGPIPIADDPNGMFITADDQTRSVRTAPLNRDERLLIVTGETFRPGEPDAIARRERLRSWATRTFPSWRETHTWSAHDTTSTDRIPFVGRLNPDLYVATGFGGWGMTNGVHAGKLIARQIAGEPDVDATRVFDPRRIHPVAELKPIVRGGLKVAEHVVGDRIRTAFWKFDPTLAPDTAEVAREGAEWIARYRDDDSVVHGVSARCTHLGCLVAFNDADRVWECPCHGSRFSIDGDVLHGPATEPLKQKQ